jgi:protein O-GlcNAc transferase
MSSSDASSPSVPSDSAALVYATAFERGALLHREGQLESALVSFERALEARPADADAASACATLLMQLGRPKAAYQTLYRVREVLLRETDGATNWGIVCEAVGQTHEAKLAYETALQHDVDNVRALNNAALLALQHSEWPLAISHLLRCLEIQPDEPAFYLNLCDAYSAAHEAQLALQTAQIGWQRFPQQPELELRVAAQLAHTGQIEAAQTALEALSQSGQQLLAHYMRRLSDAGSRVGGAVERGQLDAEQLYFVLAFSALNDCDWRGRDALPSPWPNKAGKARIGAMYSFML